MRAEELGERVRYRKCIYCMYTIHRTTFSSSEMARSSVHKVRNYYLTLFILSV